MARVTKVIGMLLALAASARAYQLTDNCGLTLSIASNGSWVLNGDCVLPNIPDHYKSSLDLNPYIANENGYLAVRKNDSPRFSQDQDLRDGKMLTIGNFILSLVAILVCVWTPSGNFSRSCNNCIVYDRLNTVPANNASLGYMKCSCLCNDKSYRTGWIDLNDNIIANPILEYNF